MIERYRAAGLPTLLNDGQWVSYEQHEKRMKEMLSALKMVIQRITIKDTGSEPIFDAYDCSVIDEAFYSYCDEIPEMYPVEKTEQAWEKRLQDDTLSDR